MCGEWNQREEWTEKSRKTRNHLGRIYIDDFFLNKIIASHIATQGKNELTQPKQK